jgi:hypothetical protein
MILAALLVLALGPSTLAAQRNGPPPSESKNALELSPMSPLFKIYALIYARRVTPNSEILIGPLYTNIHYEDIGNTDARGFIVGYRRNVWRALHVDYQVMPQWDHFYEKNEDRTYPIGFDLWNEFRLGYGLEFRAGPVPAYVNVQWPFGFALYSDDSAKPESFERHADENPFFYFPPMLFAGVRF